MTTMPRNSFRRKLLFAGLTVVGFFVLAEVALRIIGIDPPRSSILILRDIDVDIEYPFMQPDRELFWAPSPGFQDQFRGKEITINALGLRGHEIAIPKPTTKKRILCFGDSITFGYGVSDRESYPYLLGELLSPRGAEVVNAGVTGYSSHQVLRLARRLARTLEPDIALFLVGWNDGTLRPVNDQVYARRFRLSTAADWISGYSYVHGLLKTLYLRSFEHEWETPPETPRVSLVDYGKNLAALVEEYRSRNIAPFFIDLPRRKRAGEETTGSSYSEVLTEVGRRLSVPVIDPGDLGLKSPLDTNAHYFIDTLHLSPAGNAYLAERLVRELAELDAL